MKVSRNKFQNCKIGSQLFDFEKSTCNIPGCLECVSPTTCSKCKDDAAEIVGGICKCKDSSYSLTESGFCVACRSLGCVKCSSEDPSMC